jgi:hypothetical protein
MKRSRTQRRRIVAAATLALAFSIPVGIASASGLTLNLTASSTPVVGRPLILQATGTIPLQDLAFPYWFSLDAIPTAVTTTCPPDRWEGAQFAQSNGSILVLSQHETPDPTGHFAIPVAVTPSAPGSLLLCAYTDDGAASTLAAASLTLHIQPKQSTGPSSTAAGIPTQARRGIRSCLALLGAKDGQGCIRSVIRRANRACRRLHSPKGRAACLRAVRKVDKGVKK